MFLGAAAIPEVPRLCSEQKQRTDNLPHSAKWQWLRDSVNPQKADVEYFSAALT
jgi:hypothetical protein